jgi:hypothetical protein
MLKPFAESEYETLRATIGQRGANRISVVLMGLVAWGALAMASSLTHRPGAGLLVPLVILAATFELNFFVHTGIERIGRYVQVFYEEASGSQGWETTVMRYGAKFPASPSRLEAWRTLSSGGRLDPLFIVVFSTAAAVNFFSAFAAPQPQLGWIALSLILHSLFAYRIVEAQRAAASQRTLDLDRFRSLLSK